MYLNVNVFNFLSSHATPSPNPQSVKIDIPGSYATINSVALYISIGMSPTTRDICTFVSEEPLSRKCKSENDCKAYWPLKDHSHPEFLRLPHYYK